MHVLGSIGVYICVGVCVCFNPCKRNKKAFYRWLYENVSLSCPASDLFSSFSHSQRSSLVFENKLHQSFSIPHPSKSKILGRV